MDVGTLINIIIIAFFGGITIYTVVLMSRAYKMLCEHPERFVLHRLDEGEPDEEQQASLHYAKMEFDKEQQTRHYGWVRAYQIVASIALWVLFAILLNFDLVPNNYPGIISWAILSGCAGGTFFMGIFLCYEVYLYGNRQKQFFSKAGKLEIIIHKSADGIFINRYRTAATTYSIEQISRIKVTNTHIIIFGSITREKYFPIIMNIQSPVGTALVNKVYIPRNFTNENQITGLDINRYNAKQCRSAEVNAKPKRVITIWPIPVAVMAIVIVYFWITGSQTAAIYNEQRTATAAAVSEINKTSDFLGLLLLEDQSKYELYSSDPAEKFFNEMNDKRKDGKIDRAGGWPRNMSSLGTFNGKNVVGGITINTQSPYLFGIHIGDDYSLAKTVLSKEGYHYSGMITAVEAGGNHTYYQYVFTKDWVTIEITTDLESTIWSMDVSVDEPGSGMPLKSQLTIGSSHVANFSSYDESVLKHIPSH